MKTTESNFKPSVFGINEEFIGIGQDNGICSLITNSRNSKLVRSFKNLNTSISFMELNDNYFVFGSKWKNDSIRIFDIQRKCLSKNIIY